MAGTTIAQVARRYQLPYALLWRVLTGGYRRPPRLSPEEQQRLARALAELRQAEGGESDAS